MDMFNLELSNLQINMSISLYLLWILIVFSASIVVLVKHPIHSILALVFVFIEVGFLLLLLNLDYLAFVFLVVYVGAIAVLFLFVTMMLNIRIMHMNLSVLAYLPSSIFLVCAIFFQLFFVLKQITNAFGVFNIEAYVDCFEPAVVMLAYENLSKCENIPLRIVYFAQVFAPFVIPGSLWGNITTVPYINVFDLFYSMNNIQAFAHCFYTYFSFSVLLGALVLLVAMVGSISLTGYYQHSDKRQLLYKQVLREFVPILK